MGCKVSAQVTIPWTDDGPLRFQRVAVVDVQHLIMDHHYAKRLPGSPIFTFAWLRGMTPVACATFTAPSNRYFGAGAVELSRLVRLPECSEPLTMFLAQCMKAIRQDPRKFRCMVSYSDSTHGHHGGIYQAFNGLHVGVSPGSAMYRHKVTGALVSQRSMSQSDPSRAASYERVRTGMKYLYAWPIHEKKKAMLARYGWTELPYPKPGRTTEGA